MTVRKGFVIGFVAVMIVALTLGSGAPARAQDGSGLSEEQLALLDRVFAARQLLDTFESYVEIGTGLDAQTLTLVLGEQSVDLADVTEWAWTESVINSPDGKNVDAQLGAAVSSQGEEAFRVVGDARFVDGVLYVSAAYDPPSDDLPPLPDGWLLIEDPETIGDSHPALAALQLDNISSDEPNTLLEDQARMRETASDVTLETVTLDDGTEADRITVVFGRDAILGVMVEGVDDPFQLGLFSGLTDESGATLSALLDGEGRALEVRTTIDLIAVDIDAATLSPDDFPDGALLSFAFQGVEEQRYEQINEAREPVSAPEELAPEPAS